MIKALTEIRDLAEKWVARYPEGSGEYGAWMRVFQLADENDARTVSLDPSHKPKRKRATK